MSSLSKNDLYNLRKKHLSSSQSLSYDTESFHPLNIVSGKGAYLIDEKGTKFLDTRNNVCHVGHQNEAVIKAVQTQVAKLNTNTRYLHENVVKLAEKLTKTMDGKLSKVFFVNSGSEANDLALRLAFNFTKRRGVICLDSAYHGHTQTVIEASPYKSKKTNCYSDLSKTRILSRPIDAKKLDYYEEEMSDILSDFSPACFIHESVISCGGAVLLPNGYVKSMYEKVRKAGGLCIADEVQVGFGRNGENYWFFQDHDVCPDIVTVGKPFGNGMPLAAVVTTEEVCKVFEQGPEYFNTYGGNPVCTAAGLAVMEEIERMELIKNASDVGGYLLASFKDIMKYSVPGLEKNRFNFFQQLELFNFSSHIRYN